MASPPAVLLVESWHLYALLSAVLFTVATAGFCLCGHFLRKIIGINLMGVSVFLFLISVARRDMEDFADPVPHAMVITGIVVAVSVSAFALALARRLVEQTGHTRFDTLEDEEES